MIWIIDNQILFLVLAFAIGLILSLFLLNQTHEKKVWRYADLLWIVVGGIGALVAFIVSVFLSNVATTERSIVLVQSSISNAHSDAVAIAAKYCSEAIFPRHLPYYADDFALLCDAVGGIKEQTAKDSDAFSLVTLLEEERPNASPFSMDEFHFDPSQAAFDPKKVIEFSGMTEALSAALERPGDFSSVFFKFDIDNPAFESARIELIGSGVYTDLALEYGALKSEYERLVLEFDELRIVWNDIVEQRWLLLMRTIALGMLSFSLPLRLGKSVFEIRETE
ncbi:MAG: hypothetical protein AB8B58_00125 [Roseobacter sp.]